MATVIVDNDECWGRETSALTSPISHGTELCWPSSVVPYTLPWAIQCPNV